MKFRKREDFYKDRNKFVSFLFKWALRLSFPLRRPIAFLIVLLVLFLAPTFGGVKPQTVHIWYWEKFKIAYTYVAESVASIWNKATFDVDFFKSPFAEKGIDKLVQPSDNRAQKSKRQAFSQAQGSFKTFNVLDEKVADDIVVPVFSDEKDVSASEMIINKTPDMPQTLSVAQRNKVDPIALIKKPDNSFDDNVTGLIYLKNPKSVQGNITVYDINTIDVDGIQVILFGIYADPKSPGGVAGREFLKSFTKDQLVICKILAYTYDNVATALCYVNGININKELVIKGYSTDVAL